MVDMLGIIMIMCMVIMAICTTVTIVCTVLYIKNVMMHRQILAYNGEAVRKRDELNELKCAKYDQMIIEYQRYTDKLNEFREYVEEKGREKDKNS